jgi:membrane-associated protease RseP (regulator of RpoE activity)
MKLTALKTVLLAALLIASPASRLRARDDPSPSPQPKEKKKIVIASPERDIVIDGDDVFVSGDEDGEILTELPDFDDFPGVVRLHGGGYIGVRPIGMTPELRQHFGAPKDEGVLVGSVETESPAAKAGLEVGDIITAVGGKPIENPHELAREVRRKAGETLRLEIVRNRAAETLSVTVGTRKPEEMQLGELRPMPRFHFDGPGHPKGRMTLPPPDGIGKLENRLEELEKRLKELEDRLPPSR